jgi:hypothetical protein
MHRPLRRLLAALAVFSLLVHLCFAGSAPALGAGAGGAGSGATCPDGVSSVWTPYVDELPVPVDLTAATVAGASPAWVASTVSTALAGAIANACIAPGCCLPPTWQVVSIHEAGHLLAADANHFVMWVQAVAPTANRSRRQASYVPAVFPLDGYADFDATIAATVGTMIYPDGEPPTTSRFAHRNAYTVEIQNHWYLAIV